MGTLTYHKNICIPFVNEGAKFLVNHEPKDFWSEENISKWYDLPRTLPLDLVYNPMYKAILENTTTRLWSVEPEDFTDDDFLGNHYVHNAPDDDIAKLLLGDLEALCDKVVTLKKRQIGKQEV